MKKGKCRIEGCDRSTYGHGLCNAHYQRLRSGKSLTTPLRGNRKNGQVLERDNTGNKQCLECGEFRPESMFSAHGHTLDRKQPYCIECISSRRYYRNYGIRKKDIESIIIRQGGCAICKSISPRGNNEWHVDHDHACCPGTKTCGKCIRGILCSYCNRALGQFFDSPDVLKNAITYLEESRSYVSQA